MPALAYSSAAAPAAKQVITFRTKRLDQRTADQIAEAERNGNFKLILVQGGFNGGEGKVAASAGTHDRGGVVDFSVAGLTMTQINLRVRELRKVGLWAWYRPELWRNGKRVWGPHIHAVSVGCVILAAAAARQLVDARNGLDGLAGDGKDPHRGMGLPVISFEAYLRRKAKAEAAAASGDGKVTITSPGHKPGSRTIHRGDRGDDVKRLQKFLGLRQDGVFGPVTAAAVRRWKRRRGSKNPNSYVGPNAWKLILRSDQKKAS